MATKQSQTELIEELNDLLDSVSEFVRPASWGPPICMLDDCGCSGEEHE